MRNHQVTTPQPLLNEEGAIAEPGWAPHPIWIYDRSQIKAPWFRIKEWDYYMVVGKNFAIALTLSDIGYIGVQSISLFKLGEEPWVNTKSSVNLLPCGQMKLHSSSQEDGVNSYRGPGFMLEYEKRGQVRHLMGYVSNFYQKKSLICDIWLEEPPMESIVVATPWFGSNHFYYNQKINCMRAHGFIEFGDEVFHLDSETDFGTMDWGRGVWSYDNTWYWSSGNADIDGHAFGFNLGYGFADTWAATENALFYDGKTHKLDDVEFVMSDPEDYSAPWTFTSSDGRFEAEFTPILHRDDTLNLGFAGTFQHQVFGRMNGTAILDDGTNVPMKDILCFVEQVRMKY